MSALHVRPDFGLPYAPAGVADGLATATCPVCGHVATGATSKEAGRSYGQHFAAAAVAEAAAAGVPIDEGNETACAFCCSENTTASTELAPSGTHYKRDCPDCGRTTNGMPPADRRNPPLPTGTTR